MDRPPPPRADLTAAQRIAIALGTAEPPSDDEQPPAAASAPGENAPAGEEPVPGTAT